MLIFPPLRWIRPVGRSLKTEYFDIRLLTRIRLVGRSLKTKNFDMRLRPVGRWLKRKIWYSSYQTNSACGTLVKMNEYERNFFFGKKIFIYIHIFFWSPKIFHLIFFFRIDLKSSETCFKTIKTPGAKVSK